MAQQGNETVESKELVPADIKLTELKENDQNSLKKALKELWISNDTKENNDTRKDSNNEVKVKDVLQLIDKAISRLKTDGWDSNNTFYGVFDEKINTLTNVKDWLTEIAEKVVDDKKSKWWRYIENRDDAISDLKDVNSELKELNDKLLIVDKNLKENQTNINNSNNKIESIRTEFNIDKTKLENITKELGLTWPTYTLALEQANKKLNSLKSEDINGNNKEKIKQYEKFIENVEKIVTTINEKIAEEMENVNELKNTQTELSTEKLEIKTKINDSNNQKATLEQKRDEAIKGLETALK